jgi:hypothetical protein
MKLLEKGVRDVLNSKDGVSTAERLKAVEAGARLLMIRYRIEGSGEGEDGKFFSKSG